MSDDPLLSKLAEVNERLTSKELIADPVMFGNIVDALPDGLIVVNEDGLILLVNQQIELLFGYPRFSLIKQPVHMLLDPSMSKRHAEHIANFFSRPSVRPMNLAKALPGRHRTGRTITVQISLGPVISSQGVLALALVRRVQSADQSTD